MKDILKTKLLIQPLGKDLLYRPQLINSLNSNLSVNNEFIRKVTLLSAPAGYGKTTLARMWLDDKIDNVTWLSLDSQDNTPVNFWHYFITALQKFNCSLGKNILDFLPVKDYFSDFADEDILIPLLNDLLSINKPIYFVIDDYHIIDNAKIHKGMKYFIEKMPTNLHLVITSRSEPPWPLARWRAKGELVTLNINDLKLTNLETTIIIKQFTKILIKDEEIDILYGKTDGWITGLKLVISSLLSTNDIQEFINKFTGNHKPILQFLTEEIFNNQNSELQNFLLETSILQSFNAELCDRIREKNDSINFLTKLEKDNLFLITLDEEKKWYKYHPLFSQILSSKFSHLFPDKFIQFNKRVCSYYLEMGIPSSSLQYAFVANDIDKVASIIHNYPIQHLFNTYNLQLIKKCFQLFNIEIFNKYPKLALYKAFYLLVYGEIHKVDYYLNMAKNFNYSDENEQKEFMGITTALEVFCKLYTNRLTIDEIMENVNMTLDLLPNNDFFWQMTISVICGDALLFSGRPQKAYSYYLDTYLRCLQHQNTYFIISTGTKVAISLYNLGRMEEGEKLINELLNLAKEKGFSMISRVGPLWSLKGEIEREKGNLNEAEHYIEKGLYLSKSENLYYTWNSLYKISLLYSQKKFQQGLDLITEIKVTNSQFLPPIFSYFLTLWEAKIYLKLQQTDKTEDILKKIGITTHSQLIDGMEEGYLILFKAYIEEKQWNIHDIDYHLDVITKKALNEGNKPLYLKTLLLLYRFHNKNKNLDKLKGILEKIKRLAVDCGYYQTLIDENMDILDKTPTATTDLIEDLSKREIEILQLINKGLTNQDIADKLFLSLGTVKWYTNNIYGKLGVKNRTAALAVARKLNLL